MKPYYEGWYMKQQQGDDVLAVIPGRAHDTAFIQVVLADSSHYLPYPLDTFHHRNDMRIGGSLFTPYGMNLHIRTLDLELSGWLRYRRLTPLCSDIMGPFAFLPLETKHTVFSMRHRVDGEIVLNGKTLRFDDGLGYMEGDRGHSFPRGYTWVQSVDFPSETSIMVAIAEIPLAGFRFIGCIAVVSIDGHEHRFATYRGVRIVEANESLIELLQGDMTLRVEVLETHGHRLQAPSKGLMERSIHESPSVPVRFRFSKQGHMLLDEVSPLASFEFVAPMQKRHIR